VRWAWLNHTRRAKPDRQGGAIKAIGVTIDLVSGITTSISSAVEQQDAATKSIATGVQAAAQSTLNVSENVERVAKTARETGTTSGLMLKSAQELPDISSHLKNGCRTWCQQYPPETDYRCGTCRRH
jgi:methyl-accepting chemotaxis protein